MKHSVLALISSVLAVGSLGVACGDGERDGDGVGGTTSSGGEDGGGDGGSGSECAPSQTECDGVCASTESDPLNCGACGTACGQDEGCLDGKCERFGCSDGQVTCDDSCVDLQRDAEHCGNCDTACATGEVCENSVCEATCSPGFLECDGGCVDPLTNEQFCGADSCDVGGAGGAGGDSGTGESCESGSVCVGGECMLTCPGEMIECGDVCVDPMTDRNHCGVTSCVAQANNVCESGSVCVDGSCEADCAQGTVECGGRCVDPETDRTYCGASDCESGSVGDTCDVGEVCANGSCEASCAAGTIECGGRCVQPETDPMYCGAMGECSTADSTAGVACAAGTVCTLGVCEASCAVGTIDCGGRCVDPNTDPVFCGASNTCMATDMGESCDAGSVCSNGTCAASCAQGTLDCDGRCVDPETDPIHCGATTDCSDTSGTSGEECDSGMICANGTCETSCSLDAVDCDGRCVDPETDPIHCGATTDCSDTSGTSGEECDSGMVCTAGICATSCLADTSLCGGKCIDPMTSNAYCGADCEGGAMGTACDAGTICSAGTCQNSCAAGTIECGGRCINPLENDTFCGATDCTLGDPGNGEVCTTEQSCSVGDCRQFLFDWNEGKQINVVGSKADNFEHSNGTDAEGNTLIIWRQYLPGGTTDSDVRLYASRYAFASKTFSTPVRLDASAVKVRNPALSVSANGDAIAVWVQGESGADSEVWSAQFDAQALIWGPGVRVDDTATPKDTPDVASDGAGNAHLVWSEDVDASASFSYHVRHAYFNGSSFVVDAPLVGYPGQATDAFNPRIDVNESGDAAISWWEGPQDNSTSGAYFPFSTVMKAGAAWTTPQSIQAGVNYWEAIYQGNGAPDVSVDGDGDAYVVWSQWTDSPGSQDIWMAKWDASVPAWGASQVIENASAASSALFPRIDTNAAGKSVVVFVHGASAGTSLKDVYAVVVEPNLSSFSQTLLDSGTPAGTSSGPWPNPTAAIDNSDNMHAVWVNNPNVMTSQYLPDLVPPQWGPSINLVDGTSSGATDPQVSVALGGRAFASWFQGDNIFLGAFE